MKKSGFTLIEISVSALIVSIIATVLIVVLRGNLNTLKFGQKHMDFDRKILLTIRRMFYDLKHINPILSKSEKYGYTLKGENIGEPKPRKVFIRKSKDLKEKQDELEFVIDSNLDVDAI
ncbi:MAG: type II secretion system protein, partial [Candidatus Riflebacteria bacterium]|nr:type II secretion system protein [Candidatus Riflebacteria bacterium]